MKAVFPWIFILALLGGVYFLYSANREKDAQLAKLNLESAELDKLRAENEELRKLPAQDAELARLRKENEDVLRLRNEVQWLHDQTKQLNAQLGAAQAHVNQAQTQGAVPQQVQQQLAQLAEENKTLRGDAQKYQEQDASVCINNLRMLDGAKQAWAVEHKAAPTDAPTLAELLVYLGPGAANKLVCPKGGTYTVNNIQTPPACSVAGHALQ